MVTHSPLLLAIADNLVALDHGKVALAGPAKEILPNLLGKPGAKNTAPPDAKASEQAKTPGQAKSPETLPTPETRGGMVKPRTAAATKVSAKKGNGGKDEGKGKTRARRARTQKAVAESTTTAGMSDETPDRGEAPAGARVGSGTPEDK